MKDSLKTSHSSLDTIHDGLYESCLSCRLCRCKTIKKHTCGRMQYRSNQTVNDTKDYSLSVTTPFVEHLIAEMEERFGDAPTTVVKGFSIIPSIFVNQANWKPDFIEFSNCYANDLPSSISILLLLWATFWRNGYLGNLPSSISKTLKITHKMRRSLPNTYAALKLLATIPVTSCECECVSVLRCLKTYLRSTMEQKQVERIITHEHSQRYTTRL